MTPIVHENVWTKRERLWLYMYVYTCAAAARRPGVLNANVQGGVNSAWRFSLSYSLSLSGARRRVSHAFPAPLIFPLTRYIIWQSASRRRRVMRAPSPTIPVVHLSRKKLNPYSQSIPPRLVSHTRISQRFDTPRKCIKLVGSRLVNWSFDSFRRFFSCNF